MGSEKPTYAIRSIRIENFRGIDLLELDFHGADGTASEIAVLAGPNGCGKTAVLEACLIAVGFDGPYQGKTGIDAIRSGQTLWRILVDIQAPFGIFKIECQSNRAPQIVATSGTFEGRIPAISSLYFSSWRAPQLVGALPITLRKGGKRHKETEPNRMRLIKQRLINLKAHSMMSDQDLFPLDMYKKMLDRLSDAWVAFYPQSKARFLVEPDSNDPETGFDVYLKAAGSFRIPIDRFSSGQLELFLLFGSLILSRFDEGIVVIDEPELHLDPQWHARLIRAIGRLMPKAQLIVATHSPKVYDSVFSFQRHLLLPDADPRAVTGKVWETEVAGV